MKTIVLSAAAGLALSAAAAGAVWSLTRPKEARRSAQDLAAVKKEVAALWRAQETLAARIAAVEAVRPGQPAASSARAVHRGADLAEIEEAKAVVGAEAVADATAGDGGPAGEAAPETTDEKLEKALETLFDQKTDWGARQKIWRDLTKAGLIDHAIEAFERRAKENPGSAAAQAEAGLAYLQKLNTVGDLEKGTWAMKADSSFDAALAIDEWHWDARFAKAMSLSFWPAITGKQGEAIRHFEVLRGQQEALPAEEKFAQTYVFLGNLYQTRGETAKAAAIWKEGASRFPGNSELVSRAREEERK